MKFSLFVLLVLSSPYFNKSEPFKTGVYGAYMDASTYTELTINPDSSFKYIDQFELGSTIQNNGIWQIKRKRLLLKCAENNKVRPMPTEWKIKENQLEGKFMNTHKKEVILTLRRDKKK